MGQDLDCLPQLGGNCGAKQGQEGKIVTDGTERLCLHLQTCLLPLGLPLPRTCHGMEDATHPHMDTLSYFRRWDMEPEDHLGSKIEAFPLKLSQHRCFPT